MSTKEELQAQEVLASVMADNWDSLFDRALNVDGLRAELAKLAASARTLAVEENDQLSLCLSRVRGEANQARAELATAKEGKG